MAVASKGTGKKKTDAKKKKSRKTIGFKSIKKGLFGGYQPGIYAEPFGLTAANFRLMARAEERAKQARKDRKDGITSEQKRAALNAGRSAPRRSPFFASPGPVVTVPRSVVPAVSPRPRSRTPTPAPVVPQTEIVLEAKDMLPTLSTISKSEPKSGAREKTRSKLVRINASMEGVLVGTLTISHGLPKSNPKQTSQKQPKDIRNTEKLLGYEDKRAQYTAAIRSNLFANVSKAPGNFKEGKTTYVIEAKFADGLPPRTKKEVFAAMLKVAQEEARRVENPYLAVFKNVDGNAATAAANYANKINNGGSAGMLFRLK